jgi:hypothetical protein
MEKLPFHVKRPPLTQKMTRYGKCDMPDTMGPLCKTHGVKFRKEQGSISRPVFEGEV